MRAYAGRRYVEPTMSTMQNAGRFGFAIQGQAIVIGHRHRFHHDRTPTRTVGTTTIYLLGIDGKLTTPPAGHHRHLLVNRPPAGILVQDYRIYT